MSHDVLTGILREAMVAERTGHQFYSVAAERSEDPGAKRAFAALAEEERTHYEALQRRYRELLGHENTSWDPIPEAEHRAEASASMFSPTFHDRLRGRHFEMSALAIGVLLEKESIAFYSKQAQEAAEPQIRAFFERLVAWETEHYDGLLQQQNALREEDWQANRFEPLL